MDKRNIEAIFPVSAMQRAMLLGGFAGGTDPGFLQVEFDLHGPLNKAALKQAWEYVVERHAALRMTIQSPPEQQPLVVAGKTVPTRWSEYDWLDVDEPSREAVLSEFLANDRRQGLDLAEPPSWRMSLIRLTLPRHHVVWSCHHALLDGWSAVIALREWFASYEALLLEEFPALPPIQSTYQDYLAWRKQQDTTDAENYFRSSLGGLSSATPLPAVGSTKGAIELGSERVSLAEDAAKPIVARAKALGTTPSALCQAAWALVLSGLSGTPDVLFGTTVSGRAVGPAGMESLLGLFANIQPVRIECDTSAPVGTWLQSIRDEQFRMQAFEHVPLVDVRRWCDIPGHERMFESLLVVENFPFTELRSAAPNGWEVRNYHSAVTTTYPLTFVVGPGARWNLECLYDARRFSAAAASDLLQQFMTILQAVTATPRRSVSTIRDEAESRWLSYVPQQERPSPASSHGDAADDSEVQPYVAPRTETEETLAAIWESALGIKPIGVRDDFFRIGGRSIVAVEIFAQIERQLGKRLPLALLLEQPTIENLATAISGETPPECFTALVPIRQRGSMPPLICVHAGGGHVLFSGNLARRMHADRPIYALQPVGLDGQTPPLRTMPEMAAHYIEELLDLQPEGPYFLAGHCAGAVVCYEMAQQLTAAGMQVGLLAVLDSEPPRVAQHSRSAWKLRLAGARARVKKGEWWPLIRSAVIVGSKAARRPVTKVQQRFNQAYGDETSRHDAVLVSVQNACREAYQTYSTRPYPGKVTLIRSAEFERRSDKDYHLWWGDVAAEFECHTIAVEHQQMLLDPHVEHLARLLETLLENNRGVTPREPRRHA